MKACALNMIGLPVITESNIQVGLLADFVVDVQTHQVVEYHVKSKNPIKGLFAKKLIVSTQQVVRVTNKKIIVKDEVVEEAARIWNVQFVSLPNTSPEIRRQD